MSRPSLLIALSAALLVAACTDPAAGKAEARVEEAAAPSLAESAPVDANGPAYVLDAAASKLAFTGSKVTGSHDGGFETFTATARLRDGTIAGGSVTVEIDTTSIFSDSDRLTAHLESPDFFDVEQHPKATFVSTAVTAGGTDGFSHTVQGNLTLHGITKKITFPATIAKKGDRIDVDSEFSINRKDFGMEYPGKPDDLIRDAVVIELDLTLKSAGEPAPGA